jgi:hypothetical protein
MRQTVGFDEQGRKRVDKVSANPEAGLAPYGFLLRRRKYSATASS